MYWILQWCEFFQVKFLMRHLHFEHFRAKMVNGRIKRKCVATWRYRILSARNLCCIRKWYDWMAKVISSVGKLSFKKIIIDFVIVFGIIHGYIKENECIIAEKISHSPWRHYAAVYHCYLFSNFLGLRTVCLGRFAP